MGSRRMKKHLSRFASFLSDSRAFWRDFSAVVMSISVFFRSLFFASPVLREGP